MLQSDYRFRVVRDFEDLVEKIRIFEAGLDDRAIEWAKCVLGKTCTKDRPGGASDASGMELEFVKPRFRRWVEKDGKRYMEFTGPHVMKLPGLGRLPLALQAPESLYQRALQHLEKHLPWPTPVNGDFLLVDEDYIQRVWPNLPEISERGAAEE